MNDHRGLNLVEASRRIAGCLNGHTEDGRGGHSHPRLPDLWLEFVILADLIPVSALCDEVRMSDSAFNPCDLTIDQIAELDDSRVALAPFYLATALYYHHQAATPTHVARFLEDRYRNFNR